MKKEVATDKVRVYPTTRRRLRIRAAKEGKTLARIIDDLERHGKKKQATQ